MKVEVGDVYVRRRDGKAYRVKRIDHTMVVLESYEDETQHSLTDIFGLEKAYSKRESKPAR